MEPFEPNKAMKDKKREERDLSTIFLHKKVMSSKEDSLETIFVSFLSFFLFLHFIR